MRIYIMCYILGTIRPGHGATRIPERVRLLSFFPSHYLSRSLFLSAPSLSRYRKPFLCSISRAVSGILLLPVHCSASAQQQELSTIRAELEHTQVG